MKLCIVASDHTIGSMLAQEDENGVERAIYYLSRVLNDVDVGVSPNSQSILIGFGFVS